MTIHLRHHVSQSSHQNPDGMKVATYAIDIGFPGDSSWYVILIYTDIQTHLSL